MLRGLLRYEMHSILINRSLINFNANCGFMQPKTDSYMHSFINNYFAYVLVLLLFYYSDCENEITMRTICLCVCVFVFS